MVFLFDENCSFRMADGLNALEDGNTRSDIKIKVFKHRIKDPQKVMAGKLSMVKRRNKLIAKNPVSVALIRNKTGRYKTTMDFRIALKSAITRCKKSGVPYMHLLPA